MSAGIRPDQGMQFAVHAQDQGHQAVGVIRHQHILDFPRIPAKDANRRAAFNPVNLAEADTQPKRVGPEPLPIANGKKARHSQPQAR